LVADALRRAVDLRDTLAAGDGNLMVRALMLVAVLNEALHQMLTERFGSAWDAQASDQWWDVALGLVSEESEPD
jgi:hypothetical protein